MNDHVQVAALAGSVDKPLRLFPRSAACVEAPSSTKQQFWWFCWGTAIVLLTLGLAAL